ncbi:hypothetical protein EPUS_05015 [Endocarpon pusillum Z07020]|uniref:Major facilitator superfamily (MFS) profile domain-containing protein n=1 Tax=Endocarpon pusillum (strain Z07020 / HMAS-L-300199) TaxID=1263415 RepID=U1HUF3_ENDPU|nr:uncharacterized protein EPUS_05015 [Endocarpon pusillum Z07020]ERF72934.1 hypothetical protein EPUS_05015 [Endocarpon pusillum Z07020]
MALDNRLSLGYQWRSSRWFIISCIAIALFSENFLYSYIAPILPAMLEDRLHVGKSETQAATALVLSVPPFVSMVTGPLVGHLADKMPNRKSSLLMSLGAEMIGTIVTMISPSVPILLVGRGIQAIGGNAAWIVGLATLADTVGQENTGKTLGTISSFFASGLLFGPITSGMLLPLVGYWITWMVAISVLVVDMIMRVVMIENKQSREVYDKKNTLSVEVPNDIEAVQANDPNEVNEQTALLHVPSSENEDENYSKPQSDMATNFKPISVPELTTPSENFYTFILTNPRALTALACQWTMAVILLSLDTTLPLHATRTFGWDTAGVSLMFLILQMPSLLLAPSLGMLKDRVGTKIPTGFGCLAMAFSLWLLGAAANGSLFFASIENKAQTITMVALTGIGIARTFVNGSGIMEITNLMKDVQREQPNRFGPNGKMSSAYSLTNFTWNLGMLMGPVISGSLTRTVGYYYMNMVLGTFIPPSSSFPDASLLETELHRARDVDF